MAKRFTDTEIWQEDWFLELTNEERLFWFYLKDQCNHAGIWRVNRKRFEFISGKKMNLSFFLEKANAEKQRIQVFGDKWYILSFIKFQYGPIMNPENRVHKSILKELNDCNIDSSQFDPNLTPIRPQNGVKHTPKDKDIKEIGKEGVGEKERDQFEAFRKLYPGTKLGHDTEFATLKKHKDWKSILPLLLPAIQAEMRARATAKQQNRFFAEPKNLKTYLNQRAWEAFSEGSAKGKLSDEEQYEAYRKIGISTLSPVEWEWIFEYQRRDLGATWKFDDDEYLMKPDKFFTRKMANEYAAH